MPRRSFDVRVAKNYSGIGVLIKKNSFIKEITCNRFLYLLTLPTLVFIIVFNYIPMLGVIIAFKDFNMSKGFFGGDWVGFKNFEFFFQSNAIFLIIKNTVFLNVMFIAFTMLFAIAIAVFLNEVSGGLFKKITQSVMLFPSFISWIIVSSILVLLLSTDSGFINMILKSIGMKPVEWNSNPIYWPWILTVIRVWKSAGMQSVIFLGAISGMDVQMFEAARIDGASRRQRIWHITLPCLSPTILILLILAIGQIFYGDFGMIYGIVGDNGLLLPTTDVIDTYVYRALRKLGDIGMSSAVGLFQSVLGFIFIVFANLIAGRYDRNSTLF